MIWNKANQPLKSTSDELADLKSDSGRATAPLTIALDIKDRGGVALTEWGRSRRAASGKRARPRIGTAATMNLSRRRGREPASREV